MIRGALDRFRQGLRKTSSGLVGGLRGIWLSLASTAARRAAMAPASWSSLWLSATSRKLTETMELQPGSIMVTPYRWLAVSIVSLLWVMTRNWVLRLNSRSMVTKRWMLLSSSGASASSSMQKGEGLTR